MILSELSLTIKSLVECRKNKKKIAKKYYLLTNSVTFKVFFSLFKMGSNHSM